MSTPLRETSCACINLRRASRAVCHLYDLVLSPAKLKSSQWMILQTIGESGEIAHCDLAREFAASIETLSRRLASARKAGLVRVRSGDRQRRIYSLTTKGRRALETATPHWENAQMRLRRTLGESDWNLLAGFSERLTQAAIQAEEIQVANHGVRRPRFRRAENREQCADVEPV